MAYQKSSALPVLPLLASNMPNGSDQRRVPFCSHAVKSTFGKSATFLSATQTLTCFCFTLLWLNKWYKNNSYELKSIKPINNLSGGLLSGFSVLKLQMLSGVGSADEGVGRCRVGDRAVGAMLVLWFDALHKWIVYRATRFLGVQRALLEEWALLSPLSQLLEWTLSLSFLQSVTSATISSLLLGSLFDLVRYNRCDLLLQCWLAHSEELLLLFLLL